MNSLSRRSCQKPTKSMSQAHKRLSRQYLILGNAIATSGATLGAIVLLTTCSQPPVKQKPLVSQQIDKATPISQTELRSCRADDLQAVLDDFQGGAGSRFGRIKFTNTAKIACVLQGSPKIELLNSVGQSLPVKERALQSGEVGSKVIVQPQQQAYLAFRWSNWCLKEANNDIKFVVNLPGGQGKIPVILPNEPPYHAPPPCNGPDEPSSLSVKVFSSTPSP